MVPKEEHAQHGAATMIPTTTTSSTTADSSSSVLLQQQQQSAISDNNGGFYYLSEDARKQLPLYQYRGSDLSLVYHYVLSPLASWLVNNVTPTTTAPNTITTIGLVWMITSYMLYWYYVPTLNCADGGSDSNDDNNLEAAPTLPPCWIFLWNGISMLAYQTLDNMDGKQARRTKSSSPLGLLFDHGCDAVNSIFGSANWIIGMNLNPTKDLWQCWALIFGPFAMFYISTWEQYYTGELIMPIINGPNEGLLGGAMLSFTSFFYGNDFWQGTDWWDALTETLPFLQQQQHIPTIQLRNCDFVIIASCIGFVQEIVLKSVVVTRRYNGSVTSLLPFVVLTFCFWVVGWKDPQIWLDLPRTSLHLAMVLFVEQVTDLMVAHVTAQPFWPYRWQVVPLLAFATWVVIFRGIGGDNDNNKDGSGFFVQYFVMAYTCGMAAYMTMKSVLLIHEICEVLQIYCFDIVTPHHTKQSTRIQSYGTDAKEE
jgi:ethanolaminephosphotransferase